MICSDRAGRRLPESSPIAPPTGRHSPYGRPFWLAYLANWLVMVALALLYRYADFVTLLGGDEFHLGWIVGVGMVGSLLMRLLLGVGIDQYGTRLIWLGSVVLFAASCFAHLWITSCYGPAIYLLRIAFCCSIAGMFGASMTFISGRVPVPRMAEMIGMLGTAGFLGIVVGTQLGDFLLGTRSIQRLQVEQMFLVAGILGSCAVLFVWLATLGQVRPERRRRPPLFWLLRRYQPGTVLLAGVAVGIGLGLPATFLRTYAAELDIPRIGLFFGVYAPTAVVTRLSTRRLPERLGLEPIILLGLGALAVGQLLFLVVGREWQLVIPGFVYGISHAVLFPAVLAAGSRAFPNRYRGLGTTLSLATYDVGLLVGAPAAGAIVSYSHLVGLPGYPTMFVTMAAVLGLVAVFYGLTCRRSQPWRPVIRRPHAKRPAQTPRKPPPVEVGKEELAIGD